MNNGVFHAPAAAMPSARPEVICNRTFDEISVGDEASIERLTAADARFFALLSGDTDPQSPDSGASAAAFSQGAIAHSMWAAALIPAILGTRLPGSGSIHLGQTLSFLAPVRIGGTLTASAAAARAKGIVSPVAGVADILVVPDLESGNMLAKQLEYLGGATSAGIVMGARVPIVLTSRADSREARIASCAVASLVAHHYRGHAP